MGIRWPLEIWKSGIGVSSSTRRSAILSGGMITPEATNLGELRKFVSALEKWPDQTDIRPTSGAVLAAEYYENADPLVTRGE